MSLIFVTQIGLSRVRVNPTRLIIFFEVIYNLVLIKAYILIKINY
jgi:hypothetical protein